MDDQELTTIVARLDDEVPRETAYVTLSDQNGVLMVTANRLGFLRLGVELLKAASMPLMPLLREDEDEDQDQDEDQDDSQLAMDALLTDDSYPVAMVFERVEERAPAADPDGQDDVGTLQLPASSRWGCVMLAVMLALLIVGLITVCQWLLALI